MYLFLFAFGAMLSLAGVILAASGLSIHDRTFDASLVTPGIVGVVGGLLLIGLGFALRVLQRIERALEMRPALPRTADIGAPPEPAAATEPASDIARISFPVRITRSTQGAAAAESAPAADKRGDEPPLRFPKVVRASSAPAPEEADPSPRLPPLPAAGDDEAASDDAAPSFSRPFKARNGAASSTRLSPRLDSATRAPLATQRPTAPAFKALWKGPRRSTAQARPAPEPPSSARQPLVQESGLREAAIQEPVLQDSAHEPAVPERAASPPAVAPNIEPEQAAEPVTVLKSGIVDGMAYTLYSDGSIEAQLPQGLLRFGSITELRAHIEQDTPNS